MLGSLGPPFQPNLSDSQAIPSDRFRSLAQLLIGRPDVPYTFIHADLKPYTESKTRSGFVAQRLHFQGVRGSGDEYNKDVPDSNWPSSSRPQKHLQSTRKRHGRLPHSFVRQQ